VASLPGGLPSLKTLLEEVRAPGAARAEVDALLAGLAQPPPPEHSAREHADLLLSLIDDAHLSSFAGTGGNTVRGAAVQALLALGYPYALEVPPEALEERSLEPPSQLRGLLSLDRGQVGFGLFMVIAVLLVLALLYVQTAERLSAESLWIGMGFIAATTVFPPLLTRAGGAWNSKPVKVIGLVWQFLSATLFVVPAPLVFVMSHGDFTFLLLIPAAMGALLFTGTCLMAFHPKP
jgi:hypothetical protein